MCVWTMCLVVPEICAKVCVDAYLKTRREVLAVALGSDS